MSNKMLEQAIIDANALREVALKNAESVVVEKYSQQIKEAVDNMLEQDEEELDEIYRVELLHMLHRPNLMRLENHDSMIDWVVESSLSNSALFELIGCSVFDDAELRYELLSEPSCEKRSKRVLSELSRLDRMLTMIDKQSLDQQDGGVTNN